MMRTPGLFMLLAALAAPAAAVEYRSVLPQQSQINFEYRQMGVPIKGSFKRFTAQMAFDPAQPELARARIDIDLASIDAGSPEADEESAGKLWFNRSAYPKATFVSREVHALANNRFELVGTLTLKGRSRELRIPVTYVPDKSGAGKRAARFDGAFALKRLDFGVGEGMWADVNTVANDVRVTFRIAATGN